MSKTIASPKVRGYVAQSAVDAYYHIFSGILYLLQYHTWKTVPVLLFAFGSYGALAFVYFTWDKVHIQEMEPISVVPTFSIHSQAFAGGPPTGDSIVIAGKFYGYNDSHYKIYKLWGFDALMIYDTIDSIAIRVQMPTLDENKIQQYKKSK